MKQYIDKSIQFTHAYENSITIPSCPPHGVVIEEASPSASAANGLSQSQPHCGMPMNSYMRQLLPPPPLNGRSALSMSRLSKYDLGQSGPLADRLAPYTRQSEATLSLPHGS